MMTAQDIEIVQMWINKDSARFKADVRVMIGGVFEIRDIKIVQGRSGEFVSWPSRKYQDKEGNDKWVNIVDVKDPEARQSINTCIIAAYRAKLAEFATGYTPSAPPRSEAPAPAATSEASPKTAAKKPKGKAASAPSDQYEEEVPW